MKGNILEAVVLLRIARDKLEEEANVLTHDKTEKSDLFTDAAADVSDVLVNLWEYGV